MLVMTTLAQVCRLYAIPRIEAFMNRMFVLSLVWALSWAPSSAEKPKTAATVPAVSRLADVKTIYVAPLGSGDGSDLIREKVINRLVKSGVVSICETPESADAILTGASHMSKRHWLDGSMNSYGGSLTSHTRYAADCAVRVVSKNNRILWTDEESTRRFFLTPKSVRAASSNVADRLVKALIKTISAQRTALSASGSDPAL
jgi:hypothetical protein